GSVLGSLTAIAVKWPRTSWQELNLGSDGHFNTMTPLRTARYSMLDLSLPSLIGLNVGLAAGLLGAYLPDQSRYGPTWRRILLIDLAAGAGALAGGVGGCVADVHGCLNASAPDAGARALAAKWALAGAAAGAIGGVLLTRHYDDEPNPAPTATSTNLSLSTTLMPLRSADGRMTTGV